MAQIEIIIQEELMTRHMFSVNLNHHSRPDVIVCPGQIVIKKGKFSFSAPKGKYTLKISEAVLLPAGLDYPFVLKPGTRMFSLQVGDFIGTTHEIDVKGLNVINFNICFRQRNILDCKWKEGRKLIRDGNITRDISLTDGKMEPFKVRYTVTLTDAEGKTVTSDKKVVEVSMEKFNDVKPAFTFVPDDDFRDGIEYSSAYKEPVRIGTLRVSNSSSFLAAPSIDTSFEVVGRIGEENISDLLSLDEPTEIVNHWDRGGYLIPQNAGNVIIPCVRTSRNKFTIKDLDTNKKDANYVNNDSYVSFPVLLDMSRIGNPEEDKDLIIAVRYRYKKSYESNMSELQDYPSNHNFIVLKRNPEVMKLKISFYDFLTENNPAGVELNQLDPARETAEDFVYPKYDILSNTSDFELFMSLSNTATAGNESSALIIKDFMMEAPQMNGMTVHLTDNRDMMQSLFSIDGPLLSSDGVIRLYQNTKTHMTLTYRPRYLDGITVNGAKAYSGTVRFPYRFKYAVDADGQYSAGGPLTYIEVKGAIAFRISKAAAKEWLCVDFGSSAVVGAYGTGLTNAYGTLVDNLIPLKDKKQACLLSLYPDVNDPAQEIKREDNSEVSNYLVNSAIILKGVDVKGSSEIKYTPKEYGKHSVWFSPSSGMQNQNIKYLMPCLKSMMGHKALPANLIPDDLRQQGLSEVEVNTVFKAVYKQLFGCFLNEKAAVAQRLVMSVPNTYSPVHLEILKDIAKDCMPNLRPDYTNFISESDAVACYYLFNQLDFCRNSGIDPAQLHNSNVLVYDMGAGTLDLTYFRQSNSAGKHQISIEGKMGVSKAGNYLDYVLAEIVVDLIKQRLLADSGNKEMHLNDVATVNEYIDELNELLSLVLTADKYSDAFYLKNYVKNEIKKRLNAPDEPLPTGLILKGKQVEPVLSGYKVADILSHKAFKSFLKETTEDVFRHFASLFGNSASDTDRMKIDVVIFSGRMTGMMALRNAVKSSLNVFMSSEESVRNCMYADLASKKFVDINEKVSNVTNLKTVVVEGAMAYCTQFNRGDGQFKFTNSNVYATYGLILEKQDRGVIWLPLIDKKTTPSRKGKEASADGMTINEYDTDKHFAARKGDYSEVLDMQGKIITKNLNKIHLVQSYSADPALDWSQGSMEMMTLLETYTEEFKSHPQLTYRMTINERNEIHFSFEGANEFKLPQDDINNEALRKSNWPLSFGH